MDGTFVVVHIVNLITLLLLCKMKNCDCVNMLDLNASQLLGKVENCEYVNMVNLGYIAIAL